MSIEHILSKDKRRSSWILLSPSFQRKVQKLLELNRNQNNSCIKHRIYRSLSVFVPEIKTIST